MLIRFVTDSTNRERMKLSARAQLGASSDWVALKSNAFILKKKFFYSPKASCTLYEGSEES